MILERLKSAIDHREKRGSWQSHIDPSIFADAKAEIERLQAALDAVAGFGSVNLASEWEGSLRDIIRSMTDCARNALTHGQHVTGETK